VNARPLLRRAVNTGTALRSRGAAVLEQMARRDRRWALLAGLIVALLPSQVLWSSLILKDAAVWAALSSLAAPVAVSARSSGRRLALQGTAAAVLLVLLGYL
jgi:hypothetical protein